MISILSKAAFVFLLLLPCSSLSAESDSLKSLYNRVQTLESYKGVLEDDVKNKKTELTNSFESLKIEIEAERRKRDRFDLIVGSSALSVIVLSIGIIWRLMKHIDLKVKEHAEARIKDVSSDVFNDKKGAIIDLIEQHDSENQLKRTKWILVLTPRESDTSFLYHFLTTMGFENVDYHYVSEEVDLSKYSLVMFNDKDGRFDEGRLYELVSELPEKTIRFYFGHRQLKCVPNEYKDRTTFANAPLQLYGNLLNALRYQDIL